MITPGTEAIVLFTRKIITVNTAYRQFIQGKFKEHQVALTFEMLQIMACLWNEDGINQQELAYLTVKDKASITYLIDNLAKRGLVSRLEDTKDRRNKRILLTDEGRALKKNIQPFLNEMYEVACNNMDQSDLNSCMEVMDRVENNLKNGG